MQAAKKSQSVFWIHEPFLCFNLLFMPALSSGQKGTFAKGSAPTEAHLTHETRG